MPSIARFSSNFQSIQKTGGAVYYNDQDYQWNDEGPALPGAPRGAFSKQAARGKFFQMLAKQRRGGARAGDGVEVIG